MRSGFFSTGNRLRLVLIAALILGAQSLDAQDSSDSSDSDTSDTGSADATATSPDGVSAVGANAVGTTDNNGVVDNAAANPAVDPAALSQNEAIDPAAQQAIDAVTTPWGGVPTQAALGTDVQNSPGDNSVPGEPGEPGTFSPGPPTTTTPEPVPPTTVSPPARRAQIHAVIVSNLSDPSQVLSGNVNLTGGIVALGPPTPSQKPGRWDPNVQITPDPDLLNGSKIPPIVPNVIDVRITHYEVSATIESEGSVSGQP
jgi:hypothetical protein